MKSVVNTVTTILDDMRSHSRRHSDPEGLRALEERVEATLSNLVAATKTHATSSGLSPVSLLDAAASHVSAAIPSSGASFCFGVHLRPSRSSLYLLTGRLPTASHPDCVQLKKGDHLPCINAASVRHLPSAVSASVSLCMTSASRMDIPSQAQTIALPRRQYSIRVWRALRASQVPTRLPQRALRMHGLSSGYVSSPCRPHCIAECVRVRHSCTIGHI